jgi:hypothetical protein
MYDLILYFIPVIVLYFSYFIKQLHNSKKWWCILCLYLIIFLCFGYMTGSDWRSYELQYIDLDISELNIVGFIGEPGYYLYMFFWKSLGVDFWTFFISTKTICLLAIIKQINKYSNEYFYSSFAYFLPLAGFFLFIDNPMRNLIAVTIFLYALPYLMKRKYFIYILISLTATFFHLSSFFVIFFSFLLISNFKSSIIIWSYLLFNTIFFVINTETLNTFIVNTAGLIPFYERYVLNYFLLGSEYIQGSKFSLGFILKIISFIFILLARNKIENKIFGKLIFNGAIIYLFLYTFGLNIPILGRFQLYYVIFYAIANILVVDIFTENSRAYYWSYLFIATISLSFVNVTSKYVYIPYTNYIAYIGKDKPNYNYRSNYNYTNSPYYNTN